MTSPGIGSEFGLTPRGGMLFARQIPLQQHWPAQTLAMVANGRAALGLAARYALAGRDQGRVLLPAYLCHSMIQPFEELGLSVSFYPVNADLSIDADAIAARVTNDTIAIMLMHYFGFPQALELTTTLTKRFETITLIDDRTHLLLNDLANPQPMAKNVVAVYSPRKWGPFPDLGFVRWDHERVSLHSLLDAGWDWPFAARRLWGAILRGAFFAWPIDFLRGRSLAPLRAADAMLDQRTLIRRASPISRGLWQWWDWQKAGHIRRENYRFLAENWPHTEIIMPLFPELPDDAIMPLGFPIRTQHRDGLRKHLIEAGIFPPVHWQRPAQVSEKEFPAVAQLAAEELTLAIDQRYNTRHMDHILCQIETYQPESAGLSNM